jgi:hypothetical protein
MPSTSAAAPAQNSASVEAPFQWAEWQGTSWGPDPVLEYPQEVLEGLDRLEPGAWQWDVAVQGYFEPRIFNDLEDDVFAEEYVSKGEVSSPSCSP